MARFASILCAAAVLAALLSCQGRGASSVVRITPKPLGGADGTVQAAPGPDQGDTSVLRPRIWIDPQYTVLQVLNANLAPGAEEQQVIAIKKVADVGSPVKIVVVDADPERGTYYFQSWDSDTSATDTRVFSLSAKDLIGDHSLQLVASGMNESGKLTLDVFRLLPPSHGKGLLYRPVCQLVADEISVEEAERPDSYATDPKPGSSFPIVAYLRDPDSQNVMDLVRIHYSWNAAEGRYVPGAAEKIPGEEVQQAQLRTLFTSSGEQAFEQFISGSWVQPAKDTFASIITFDPVGRRISLFSGNTLEAYLWRESHRTIYNRLLAVGENETVLQIQLIRTFSITVNDPNTITVTIIGNDSGESPSVTYTKVTDDIREKLIDRPDAEAVLSTLALSGTYSGTRGLEVSFQAPRLTWTDSDGQRTGSYVVFSLGSATVLSTRFPTDSGEPDRIGSWIVDYRERSDPGSVTRILHLSPVQLTVNGYEEANGDDLTLQQTEDRKGK
ncbi:MAG: pallilysin-related adhesin [Spirochaetia bacterium]